MWLAEDIVQKRLVKALNRYEKKKKVKKAVSFLENDSKKYLSSLSRQLSETKLILRCLKFNKSNKQIGCYIQLFSILK